MCVYFCYFLFSIVTMSWKCDLDYDDRSSQTSVIQRHYVFLLETLDVKLSGLVDQLYSDKVVTQMEKEEITAKKTSFRANEKLLSVLSRKSPQQFKQFLNAVDNCGQRHVVNVITDQQGLSTLNVNTIQRVCTVQ